MKATMYLVTGAIVGSVTGPNVTPESTGVSLWGDPDGIGVNVLYGVLPEDHNRQYVAEGEIVERPLLPVSVLDTTITVPEGTAFTVSGPASLSGTTPDGIIEFEFAEPGTYTVRLSLWPHQDAEVTLEG